MYSRVFRHGQRASKAHRHQRGIRGHARPRRHWTSDEWIRTRTGIESRHFADEAEGETTSSLAVAAARRALEGRERRGFEIDLIIVATTTPDMVFPSVACRVQAALGAPGDARPSTCRRSVRASSMRSTPPTPCCARVPTAPRS